MVCGISSIVMATSSGAGPSRGRGWAELRSERGGVRRTSGEWSGWRALERGRTRGVDWRIGSRRSWYGQGGREGSTHLSTGRLGPSMNRLILSWDHGRTRKRGVGMGAVREWRWWG